MAGRRAVLDTDFLLLCQCIIYCCLLTLGLCSIISLVTAQSQSNVCLLPSIYTSVNISKPTAAVNSTNVTSGCSRHASSNKVSTVPCDFIVYTSSVEMLFLGILCIYHIFMFYKSRWDVEISHTLHLKLPLVYNFFCSVFSLMLGGVASFGYKKLRTSIKDQLKNDATLHDMQNGHDYHGYDIRLYSKQGCDIANIHNIRTNLSTDLSMVEVTLWMSCLFWIGILAITIVRHMQQQRYAKSKRVATELRENSGSGFGDLHSRHDEDEVLYETKSPYST